MIGHWKAMNDLQSEMGTYSVKDYAFALQMEVAELIDSLNWKPWRKTPSLIKDEENLKREIVDCLYFLHHIATAAGFTEVDLEKKFIEVDMNNRRRYLGGDFSEEEEPSMIDIAKKLDKLDHQLRLLEGAKK